MSEHHRNNEPEISTYGKYVSLSIGTPSQLAERVNDREIAQTYLDIENENLLPYPATRVSLESHWSRFEDKEPNAMPYIYGSIGFDPSALEHPSYVSIDDLLIRLKKEMAVNSRFQVEKLDHDPLSIYLLAGSPYAIRVSIEPSATEGAISIEISDLDDILISTNCGWVQDDTHAELAPEVALSQITDLLVTAIDTLHDAYNDPTDEPQMFHLEYHTSDNETSDTPSETPLMLGELAVGSIVKFAGLPDQSEIIVKQISAATFEKIGGLEQPKQLLQEFGDLFVDPDIAARYGIKPSPVLMYGPPGTGKSSLAEAFATYTNAQFEKISSTQIIDKYIGDSPKYLKDLLDSHIESKERTVLFFDEFDAFAMKRLTSHAAAYLEVQRVLQQYISDKLPTAPHLMLLAATNVDVSDIADALTRSGRFKPIYIPKPNTPERKDIWFVTLENRRQFFEKSWGEEGYDDGHPAKHRLDANPIPDLGNFDYTALASLTDDMTGADIEAAISDALHACYRAHRATGEPQFISQSLLTQAIQKLKRQ